MSTFLDSEIMNEASRSFRGQVDTRGVQNPVEAHRQLLDMAATAFVLHPDAIYYVSKLTTNLISRTIVQETALIEDMLVCLEYLRGSGSPVRNVSPLSDAKTALMSLNASSSILGRPEVNRFLRSMDSALSSLQPNTVSGGSVVKTPTEARRLLIADLASLKEAHASLLQHLRSFSELLSQFVGLDLASRASNSVLTNVHSTLDSVSSTLTSSTDVENLAFSRTAALKLLTSKASIQALAQFSDPRSTKYRGPVKPVPAGASFYGRARGVGQPATATTLPGPWYRGEALGGEPSVLSITVDGQAPVTVNLGTLRGSSLRARNVQPFVITEGRKYLHLFADTNVYHVTSLTTPWPHDVILFSGQRLEFKHLGATVSFTPAFPSPAPIDPLDVSRNAAPRGITELGILGSWTGVQYNTSTKVLTVGTLVGGRALAAGDVGFYLKVSTQRFEIIEYLGVSTVRVATRGITVPTGGGVEVDLHGCDVGSASLNFAPATTVAVPASTSVSIGPSVKTAMLTTGSRTAAQVVADIASYVDSNRPEVSAGMFFAGQVSPDGTQVGISSYSRSSPLVQISNTFWRVDYSIPGPATLIESSAHQVLGFLVGEADTDWLITPAELSEAINLAAPLAQSSVLSEVLLEGSGSTIIDTATFQDSTVSFEDAGVAAGHWLELTSGQYLGSYRIESVDGGTLTLRTSLFTSATVVSYRVTSDRVMISSRNTGRGSSLLVTGPAPILNMATPTYGQLSEFEAIDRVGGTLSWDQVLPGDRLHIPGSDFTVATVEPGYLVLSSPMEARVSDSPFEVYSGADAQYQLLKQKMDSALTSASGLPKHHMDQDLMALDSAMTLVVAPGSILSSYQSRTRDLLLELLGVLTANPTRYAEYGGSSQLEGLALDSGASAYTVVQVDAVDALIKELEGRGYDRAIALITEGRVKEFFETTSETASYSGNLLAASRTVVQDLPSSLTTESSVERGRILSMTSTIGKDPDQVDRGYHEELEDS